LTEALTQLVDHVARSDELIRQLLVVDDVTRLNEQLLEEAAVWIATGNQLQQRAGTIAVTDTKVLRDRLSQRLAGRGPRLGDPRRDPPPAQAPASWTEPAHRARPGDRHRDHRRRGTGVASQRSGTAASTTPPSPPSPPSPKA
jgi:hypothetical protein